MQVIFAYPEMCIQFLSYLFPWWYQMWHSLHIIFLSIYPVEKKSYLPTCFIFCVIFLDIVFLAFSGSVSGFNWHISIKIQFASWLKVNLFYLCFYGLFIDLASLLLLIPLHTKQLCQSVNIYFLMTLTPLPCGASQAVRDQNEAETFIWYVHQR